jgi:hypothetical protein
MFGSDNLPLGPNGQFPRQRISSAGNEIAPPEEMEAMYEESSLNGISKLPVRERDYRSSLNKVQNRMKHGRAMREGQDEHKFEPRGMLKRGRRLKFGA